MLFCKRKEPKHRNRIFIKDMVVQTAIGVFDEEKGRTQRVRINIIADLSVWPSPARDNLDETVSYDLFVQHTLRVAESGEHIHLVETMAERIADLCLTEKGVERIEVRVEKLDIYPFAIAGAEIIRTK